MRKIKRALAHERMKAAGYSRVNKKSGGSSFFAKHWREFAAPTTPKAQNRKRGKK